MLISPPLLLPRNNGESDDDWIDRCLSGDAPGNGAYPVSFRLEWHGGLHLTAPRNGIHPASIYAVADGKVIFARTRTAVDVTDEDHPLNYYNGYTSDGCVVIEHTTEIGEGDNAKVTFYSVYQHLNGLSGQIAQGKHISRKEVIGHAGHIYGEKDRFHFEICCDEANVKKLTGRVNGQLSTESHGRTDVVFGANYFSIPAGTPVFLNEPVHYREDGKWQPPKPHQNSAWPPIAQQAAAHSTVGELIIGLRYGGGEGSTPGGAHLTTYRPDGSTVGGGMLDEDAEYKLYETATGIVKAWARANKAAAQQYPHVPTPSAVFELLRFGRVINTAHEVLTPANAAHWRRVCHEGGEGWINLNAGNVRQFSDADFPHWKGWLHVDNDSASGDSKCDSPTIRKMLDIDGDNRVTRPEAQARLNDPAVQSRLRRTICKLPCEWEASTLEARWDWITEQSVDNPEPFTAEEYKDLIGHLRALCIACTELHAAQWRFHPKEFLKIFRDCGWLSPRELARCVPRLPGYTTSGAVRNALTVGSISRAAALSKTEKFAIPLNLVGRKYGISGSRKRQAHFLAQVTLETDKWETTEEYGRGATSAAVPMAQYYGAFFGRGLMQLTWASNYEIYGAYRGFATNSRPYVDQRISATSSHYWGDPTTRDGLGNISGLDPTKPPKQWAERYDPHIVHSDPFNACDSGAFYWNSKRHSNSVDINRVADRAFSPEAIGRISVLVNGGGNGYFERQAYAQYIHRILNDDPNNSEVAIFSTAKNNIQIAVNFTQPL